MNQGYYAWLSLKGHYSSNTIYALYLQSSINVPKLFLFVSGGKLARAVATVVWLSVAAQTQNSPRHKGFVGSTAQTQVHRTWPLYERFSRAPEASNKSLADLHLS